MRNYTLYRYEEQVGLSPHEVRLFPRTDRFSRVREFDFQVNGDAVVRYSRDLFDNVVATCFFRERIKELCFDIQVSVELEERNAFDFILEKEAVEMPFAYDAQIAPLLAPYRQRQTAGPLDLRDWTRPTATERRDTVSSLVALNNALHTGIVYERREEGAPRTPAETLGLGRGACRDVTMLLAEMLRECGLAARLVSGYLRELDPEERRAEGSLHAWAEVFLPGAGWVGMDATNGVFCNHNFISAAVGLHPADITPVSGSYHHARKLASQMTSRVEMISLEA